MNRDVLLEVRGLHVSYGRGARSTHVVRGVSFAIEAGEAFGLVGESGCGKSSTARAILQLPRADRGEVRLGGVALNGLRGEGLRRARRQFQMIFQDPVASLNPQMSVGRILAYAVRRGGGDPRAAQGEIHDILEQVGLNPQDALAKRAFQFSGGQCQRIAIARALIQKPDLLVCDEPVSSLDVSVQAQILNLLRDIRQSAGVSLLFISHDLAVVRNLCSRVGVMFAGRLCEVAMSEELFARPRHPYTAALLAAAPSLEARRGQVAAPPEASSQRLPSHGCRYCALCPRALPRCAEDDPELQGDPDHQVACHNPI